MSLGKKKIQMQGAAGFTGNDHFTPKLYTGNSSTNAITGVGFQPDFVWIKNRDNANDHFLTDSVRGAGKYLISNTTGVEETTTRFNSFDSDGFTVSTDTTLLNNASYDYVAWCWRANGSAVSNTDGTITSTVKANQDAGFSIVKWTGTSGEHSVGHGLGVKPSAVLIKPLGVNQWHWCTDIIDGSLDYLYLDSTTAKSDSGRTLFDSNKFYWAATGDNIAYCFADIAGYQKIGSYVGTGGSISAIDVGFQPRFVMVKKSSVAGGNWAMFDNLRSGTSLHQLDANDTHAEYANQGLTFTSTGFQPRQSVGSDQNVSGETFLYWAIA